MRLSGADVSLQPNDLSKGWLPKTLNAHQNVRGQAQVLSRLPLFESVTLNRSDANSFAQKL
jgi:hypothetical protein